MKLDPISVIILLLLTSMVAAQETGSIVGKLIDKEVNGGPLAFANVLIKGTTKGTTSDIDGLYEIADLDPGIYTVVYSYLGYGTVEIPNVKVEAGKVANIDVPLSASHGVSLDEVVVTTAARKDSEVALLLDQKNAVEMKSSIGAQELAQKGVDDVAGAVAKISGISKQEGSGNIYVRGLGDRYQNTALNGLSLPSNDIDKKNIDLDLFPTDVIENVVVSKAYSPTFYGDFSAGNVNIRSKDYTGNGLLELGTGAGFNTNAIGKDFVRSEGTGYFGYYGRYRHNPFAIILSHGFDPVNTGTPINISYKGTAGKSFDFANGSRLSLFLTGSFKNGFEYRKGSAVDYTLVEKKAFDAAEEYEYSTNSTIMGSVRFKVDDANIFKYTSLFINNSSDVVGYFGLDGTGRNRDAQIDTQKGFYQMNVQFDQTQMTVNQLEGMHTSGKVQVDWGLGYNLVYAKQPDRKRVALENYQYALDGNPDTNPVFYSNVVFDNQRYFQNITDAEINGRINLAYTLSDRIKFNFGYNGKRKDRDFNNIRYGYDILDRAYPVADVNDFNAIFTLDNLQLNPGDPNLYQIKVIQTIPTLSNTNRPGLPENTYSGTLNIYSGYVNTEIRLGDHWLVVPGIRAESVTQEIGYDVINLGNNGKATIKAYDNLYLPSVNVKYAINQDQNLRFTASETVSLPEFKEVAPFVYENISTRTGGNPDLLGSPDPNFVNVMDKSYSRIFNADLKYEWFLSKDELVSLGVFGKEIKNPINLVVGADATGTQRYFRTGERAIVYGLELEARKNLVVKEDRPELSFGMNATFMKTRQDLYDNVNGTYSLSFNRESDKLQGASPVLLNADIQYTPDFGGAFKPTASLVFSYFSDRVDALGSGQLGNVIEKSASTLDFVWKNKIHNKFELGLSAKNLLNPTIRYIRETTLGDVTVVSANGKEVSGYKRGLILGLQLNYNF